LALTFFPARVAQAASFPHTLRSLRWKTHKKHNKRAGETNFSTWRIYTVQLYCRLSASTYFLIRKKIQVCICARRVKTHTLRLYNGVFSTTYKKEVQFHLNAEKQK
jgi:hypothetical protein